MAARKICWVTQYYESSNAERQQENLFALQSNLNADFIDKVMIFCEKVTVPLESSKLSTQALQKRMTYADFLRLVSLYQREDYAFVLTNTDIVLSSDIARLAASLELNDVACLTRYEQDGNLASGTPQFPIKPSQTQDTWMLLAQPVSEMLLRDTDIDLGTPGCESAFAFRMFAKGFAVWNPCLDCTTTHIHASQYRTYTSATQQHGALFLPEPCTIEDVKGRVGPKGHISILRKASTPARSGA